MSNTKHLADLLKVCSILPALAIMPAMATDYTSSDIEQYPYTIKAGDSLLVTRGRSNADNGVFHNNGSLIISDDLVFIDNNTKGYGATIYLFNENSTYTKIGNNVLFSGGTALEGTSPDYDGMAGAIYSWSDGGKDGASGANVIEMGDNVTFRGNSAVDGSVMYTYGYNTITIGDNLVVEGNTATGGYGAFVLNGYDSFYGNDFINTMSVGKNALFKNNSALLRSGAVYIGGDANDKAVFDDGARFVGNSSSYGGAVAGFGTFEFGDVSFESNVSVNAWEQKLKDDGWSASYSGNVGNGGAVLNRGNFLIKGDADFLANKADSDGGAIYNGGDMTIAQSAFNANIAGQNGGAIYNYGTMDLGEAGSTFDDNIASIAGGAIYNTGDLTIKNGDFENNRITSGNGDGGALYTNTGALTLVDTDFSENYTKENAEGDMGYGGAIFAQGGTIDIQGSENDYAEFEANHALTGGAIYVSKSATSVNIENVEFEGNWASDIGALGIFGKNTTLTNLTFTDNYTTGQYKDFGFNDGGGALFFGSEAQAVLDNGVFLSNESAGVGGAIATRSPNKGDNSAAKLDIKNSTFSENVAKTNGGAIYTAFYNSESAVEHAYVTDSKFVANKANNGAAIYNEGLADRGDNFAAIKLNNVTFIDNVAETQGGAIYNGAGGTVVLSGNNMFSGNTAGKYGALNDIHNLGTLNIVSGETTISGGVSGTGVLSLAQDAKLDIGNATIVQSVIDLQGTVVASALNSRDFGRFVGDVTVGGSAKFQLNVGAVGTYKIWGDATVLESQVSVGDIYEIAGIDGQGVTIVTKSVETIAQDKGISTQAAGAVAGLANSNNGKAHQVSLALQDALDAGDAQYVEQETAKLNPDNKPVVQSVSSAMQNQVLSLTAGRMAGVMPMGRAGGDAPQENGFWVQGLFNKSKFADQFHGYTRGVAVGADTLIDRKWTIGGGLAFNNSDVHADGRHTEIDSKTLFLYGRYKPSKWFVNATATYSMSEYTETQQVAGVDLMSTYDVDAYGAQVMTGYDFATGITTEVGARYLHIAQDDYVDGRDAQIMATDTNFLSGVAGLKYAFAIENDWAVKLRPELRAAMTYDFISDDSASTVTMPGVEAYAVNGNRLSRMGGEFGLGLTAIYKGMEVSVMYDLDLHQDYTSQTGMLKFRGRF